MDGDIPFRFLPSFKLDMLASLLLKHGELQYQRLFGLRIIECQILGAVAQYGPVTLRQTCIEVGIDKGQGSRLVARLTQAGWLERRDDPQDQRSFYLLLTAAGRALQQRINVAAVERNRQWLGGIGTQEQTQFMASLDQLIRQAQAMLHEETRHPQFSQLPRGANWAQPDPGTPPLPTHTLEVLAKDDARPLLISQERLRSLHRQLGELLGQPHAQIIPGSAPQTGMPLRSELANTLNKQGKTRNKRRLQTV